MTDTPRVNLTLAQLEQQAASPEPFILALKDSQRITFPDLFDMPAEDGEQFLDELNKFGQNDFKFLEKWLSEEDFQKYKDAKITLRQHAALMNQVLGYYQASVGKPGEGVASASS